MPTPSAFARRRSDVVLRPGCGNDSFVAKDLSTGRFFELGAQEAFLFSQLDGQQSIEAICSKFQEQFHEAISCEDVSQFIELAGRLGFLTDSRTSQGGVSPDTSTTGSQTATTSKAHGLNSNSLLFWRRKLFDPDRLFTYLAPRLSFFWTKAFLGLSTGSIVLAMIVVWTNWHELVTYFDHMWRWQTIALVWLSLLVVTALHELAHGLTCKRYGGEVRDVGLVAIFFFPGMYCNVSDAWLFPEKRQRLLVTLAGGYFEMFLWSIAVFVWRLTTQDSVINYLAWVLVTVAGVRVLFNFNPFLKLDGYYLLSDWLNISNLRQRSWQHVTASLRHWFWGASRPVPAKRPRLLFSYGVASWMFSIALLGVLVCTVSSYVAAHFGLAFGGGTLVLGAVAARGLFAGLSQGEVTRMLKGRPARTTVWLSGLAAIGAGSVFFQVEDRVGGDLQLRPVSRRELRAPVAGFLKTVHLAEGDEVSEGQLILELEIPDLESRLRQKKAELAEAQANLRLLESGTRQEEWEQQVEKVRRATSIRDLARRELEQSRIAVTEDLQRLDQAILQYRTELDYAEKALERAESLFQRQVLSQDQYQEEKKQRDVAFTKWQQVAAEKRVREALGSVEAESKLAKHEDELANEQATLALMEAGTRPEEIDAAQAKVTRLNTELAYLETIGGKLVIHSPIGGVVVTPHLNEQVGRYFLEGDLICEIADPGMLEAKIELSEWEVTRVRAGDRAIIKVRALPFDEFETKVSRIAPVAAADKVQSTVAAYCELPNKDNSLRPHMQGYARVYGKPRPVGEILVERSLAMLRTQFWW